MRGRARRTKLLCNMVRRESVDRKLFLIFSLSYFFMILIRVYEYIYIYSFRLYKWDRKRYEFFSCRFGPNFWKKRWDPLAFFLGLSRFSIFQLLRISDKRPLYYTLLYVPTLWTQIFCAKRDQKITKKRKCIQKLSTICFLRKYYVIIYMNLKNYLRISLQLLSLIKKPVPINLF